MRRRYLAYFIAALALLLLPGAAHAQCWWLECESYGVYNPDTGNIDGYVRYTDYYGGWELGIDPYIQDPVSGWHSLGLFASGEDNVEVDFSYTPSDPETGQEFYIEGDCYYFLETEWVYDGYTWVDPDIPPPQPTGEWTYDVQPISGDNTGAIFSIDILPRSGAFEGGTVGEWLYYFQDGCYADWQQGYYLNTPTPESGTVQGGSYTDSIWAGSDYVNQYLGLVINGNLEGCGWRVYQTVVYTGLGWDEYPYADNANGQDFSKGVDVGLGILDTYRSDEHYILDRQL